MFRYFRPAGFFVVGTGVVLLASFLASPAMTEDGKDGHERRRGHHRMSANAMFEKVDADGSGSISKEEFEDAFNKMRDRIGKYREGRRRRGHHEARGSHGGRGGKDGKRAERGRHGGRHKCPHCRRGGGNVVHVHHHYYAGRPQERHHGPRGHWRGHRHGSKGDGKGWRMDRHRSHHHRHHGRKHGEGSDSAYQLDNKFDDINSEAQEFELSEDSDIRVSEDGEVATLEGNAEISIEEETEFLALEAEQNDESFDSSGSVDQLESENDEDKQIDDSVDLGE